MSSTKKINLLRDFAAGVYLSRAQNPLDAVYVYTVPIPTYSHREGGRFESERRLEGQQFTKLGRKYQYD
jgi:hypothetical protein